MPAETVGLCTVADRDIHRSDPKDVLVTMHRDDGRDREFGRNRLTGFDLVLSSKGELITATQTLPEVPVPDPL